LDISSSMQDDGGRVRPSGSHQMCPSVFCDVLRFV